MEENKWRKYTKVQQDFTLSDEQIQNIQDDIDSITLEENDIKLIQSKIKENLICDYSKGRNCTKISKEDLIQQIYIMRFILKLPVLHMARYLGIGHKMLQLKLQQLGWQYNKRESQQIASDQSRDYNIIRLNGKRKCLQLLKGSNMEDYVRNKINLELTDKLPNADIIVGVNNISILQDTNRECDIPIIILNDNKIHKYEIEHNGEPWHKDKKESDTNRELQLNDKGYKTFKILQFSSTADQTQYGTIDGQVDNVIKMICNDVML